MAIRTYDILLDSYNSTIPEPIVGRQGDKNGAVTLHVTITDRGTAVDLTDQTINLIAETANGTAVVADNDGVTLTDAVNGKFDYAIPNALWSEAGKITKAYFSLNDTDGQETTYDLIFIVKKAVDITQAQADDYVTIVDGTLQSLQQKIAAIQPKIAAIPKVAHLSGANNFDTVPTVNNSPLLLASSLPSDLARLSHDANFTAKLQQNGQDVALANNTIHRNPDTGSVSETNTFTAAQTFSIAPTIKDASKDKGDNQAATMADLKSVEESAWHSMTGSSDFFASFTCLYKINTAEKRIELIAFGNTNRQTTGTIIDLSSIISGITSVDGYFNVIYGEEFISKVNFSGTQITGAISNEFAEEGYGGMLSHKSMNINKMDNNPFYVYYTGLV